MTRAAALRAARELRKWSTGPICVSKYGHTAHRSNVPYGWGFEVSPCDIRQDCGLTLNLVAAYLQERYDRWVEV